MSEHKPMTDEQIEELWGESNRGWSIERDEYFKAARDAEAATAKPLLEQIAALEAELAGVKKDAERLDALEKQVKGDTTICAPGNHIGKGGGWLVSVETGERDRYGAFANEFEGPTLRAAIDAMCKEGGDL